MSQYNAIVFDLDNTLFDYDKAAENSLRSAFLNIGISNNFDEIFKDYELINHQLWKDFELDLITTEELRVKRFELLAANWKWDYSNWSLFSDNYLNFLGKQTILFSGARETLEFLSKNHKLAALTNGISEVQRERLALSELDKLFNEIIIASEYGTSKPDPVIFDIMLDKLEESRPSVLYVGDSISSDMEGARLSGLDFCWFDPSKTQPDDSHVFRFKIKKLTELSKILDYQ